MIFGANNISISKWLLAKAALKFIFIESFMPIILETPMLVASVITTEKWYEFPALAMHLFVAIFLSHSFVDPIVLILMTRPYKRQLMRMYRRIVPVSTVAPNWVVTTVYVTTVYSDWLYEKSKHPKTLNFIPVN